MRAVSPASVGDGETFEAPSEAFPTTPRDAASLGELATQDAASAFTGEIRQRFEILSELGRGGMGVVYKARDRKLGRLVALKRLTAETSEGHRAVERFLREARTIAALDHFNIVRIYNLLDDDEGPCIEMEYVTGGDLATRIEREGPLPVDDVRKIALQLCDALVLAHERGVIHRDIKPANVLLTERGTPKLADFGLARDPGSQVSMTLTGAFLGTMFYAAPEQVVSGKHVDERSDIYSLGATLYTLLTGDVPRTVRLDKVPSAFRDVVGRCLEENPEARFSDASKAREALSAGGATTEANSAGCPSCGSENPIDVKFCMKCGHDLSSLFEKCAKCGRENRRDMRFCGGCGADLAKERDRLEREKENKIAAALSSRAKERDRLEREKENKIAAALSTARGAISGKDRSAALVAVGEVLSLSRGNSDALALKAEAEKLGRVPPGFRAAPATGPEPYSKTGWAKEVIHEKTAIEMVFIPAGEFQMGSPASESGHENDEGPVHRVTITQPLYLGKYEVTQGEWQKVMGSNPSYFKGDRNPVERVSWNDCQEFFRKAGDRLRLPSEAEWEYACRAGTTTTYSFGESEAKLSEHAGYHGNSSRGFFKGRGAHPVGHKEPNGWGLYDMHGNVWEWCGDWYDSGYYGKSPGSDPQGPSTGSYRVLRGGSWLNPPRTLRSADRGYTTPGYTRNSYGLRVARALN